MATQFRIAIIFGILAAIFSSPQAVAKDESRLPTTDNLAQQAPGTEPLKLPGADTGVRAPAEDKTVPNAKQPAEDGDMEMTPDEVSLGEIPEIKTMELTPEIARHAIDSYVMVKTKYAGTDLESSENLQDFVDQNPQGKEFEADIKTAGFANVNDWNTAITTLGFAYTGFTDDPTAEIKQQIGEIEADTALAQDLKTRMITSLNAMIPSQNNRDVVAELIKDPAYAEKLKQLETVEE
ncbi:MAG: hypothetical protein ACREDX_04620 [Aestuariivirga sp.]